MEKCFAFMPNFLASPRACVDKPVLRSYFLYDIIMRDFLLFSVKIRGKIGAESPNAQ